MYLGQGTVTGCYKQFSSDEYGAAPVNADGTCPEGYTLQTSEIAPAAVFPSVYTPPVTVTASPPDPVPYMPMPIPTELEYPAPAPAGVSPLTLLVAGIGVLFLVGGGGRSKRRK